MERKVKKTNLATTVPSHLTVYEFLTELNLEQLDEMKEIVREVKQMRLREKYFREDLDELIEVHAYYRWELNECYGEGEEQIWYTCKDYLHQGMDIVIHRNLNEDEWTIQFPSIEQEFSDYVGSSRHYLKNKDDSIVREKDINAAVIHAENFIREFKDELGRI
jgi:hypothetical protein